MPDSWTVNYRQQMISMISGFWMSQAEAVRVIR
jgi:hypothetical protein